MIGPGRIRPTASQDQASWFRTRWELVKCRFWPGAHDPEDGTDDAVAGGQEGPDGAGLDLGPDQWENSDTKAARMATISGGRSTGGRLQDRRFAYHRRSWATSPWIC
jgi:hypothetical protein